MNDEYVVWLLIAAIAAVAAVLWFLYGRLPRQEDDVAGDELAAEAVWISDVLAEGGTLVDAGTVEDVLRLHRRYLAGIVPAREPGDPGWPAEPEAARAAWSEAAVASPPAANVAASPSPGAATASDGHDAPMPRDRPRREAPEADLRQPG